MKNTKSQMTNFGEWYHIPGYRGYEIDKHTKFVRSTKHYKSNPWHIMKVYTGGYVLLTDDYGNKNCKCYLDDLWNATFNNPNYIPVRVQRGDLYIGGMKEAGKSYETNINFDFSNLCKVPILNSEKDKV